MEAKGVTPIPAEHTYQFDNTIDEIDHFPFTTGQQNRFKLCTVLTC